MERCQLFDLMGARIAVAQLPHGTKIDDRPTLAQQSPRMGGTSGIPTSGAKLAGPRAG